MPPARALTLQLSHSPSATDAHGAPRPLALLDAALLAWLALEGPTPRARLAELLWPDSPVEAARNSLRQRLFKLKRQLGTDVVAGSATLELAGGVSHDLLDADRVLGDEADGFGPEFGHWLRLQRARRRDRMRQSITELCEMAESVRDWPDALAHAQEVLALDPLSEESHRRVMRLHYLAGDRAAALLAFDRCERVLKDEVGAQPSAPTLALLATVQQGQAPVRVPAGDSRLPRRAPELPASVLRPPRLVGRQAQLAAAQQAVESGQVAAVVAEAGMGKSRLLQAVREGLGGAGQVSLLAESCGRPGDEGVPFATLARVTHRLAQAPRAAATAALPALPVWPGDADARTPPRATATTALPAWPGDADALVPPRGLGAEGTRLGVHLALKRWLMHAVPGPAHAAPGAMLLCLDDLHFADAASLDVLQSLATDADLQARGLRWLLAFRPAEAGTRLLALQDALIDAAQLVRIALPPLDHAALAELVDSLGLPGVRGDALAPLLLERTGGNPLFALETLRAAWVEGSLADGDGEDGATPRPLPRPATVGRLIERRLERLSANALALARIASLAGPDFGVGLAESVLGTSALHLAEALNELEAAQVLRGVQFAHDLVADAVARGIPSAVARHCHGRMAAWLAERGCVAARLAHHWLCSDTPQRAIAPLKQAALDAATALRPREQCAFLREAARLQAEQGDRAAAFDTLHALLEVQLDVARDAEALALCDELQALASTPLQQLRVLQQRAWLLFNRSDTEAALATGQAYLARAEAQADDGLVADAHHVLGLVYSVLRGSAPQALAHMQRAAPVVSLQGAGRQRAEFHGSLAVVLANNGRLDEAVVENDRALAAARECNYPAQQAIVLGNQALNHRVMGRLEAAQRCVTEALRVQLQHDQLDGANNTLAAAAALIALERGHYGTALQRLDEAEHLLARQGPTWLPLIRARRAAVWMGLGQTARARQALGDLADPAAGSPPFVRAVHALYVARLRTLLGERADDDLARAARLAPTQGRLEVRAAIRMAQALRMTAHEGAALLDDVIALAQRSGYRASALAATIRAAQLHAPSDAGQAGLLADAALALRPDCAPVLDHAPALWLSLATTLQQLGREAEALEIIRTEAAHVRHLAQAHVPPEFRDSFLNRNPTHRDLLSLEARLRP